MIKCYSDSKSLFSAAFSLTYALDKRLRADIAIQDKMVQKQEIEKVNWVPS